MSARSGYAFVALVSQNKGIESQALVIGREPEFEDTLDIAASFDDFVVRFLKHLDGAPDRALHGIV